MKKINYILLAIGSTLVLSSCLKEYDNPAEGQLNDKAAIYVVRGAYQGSALTLTESDLGVPT